MATKQRDVVSGDRSAQRATKCQLLLALLLLVGVSVAGWWLLVMLLR